MTTTAPRTQTPTPVAEAPAAVQRPWLVVAVREVMVKLHDRNFLISTAITLAMIAAGIGLSAFLGARTTDHTVAVADDLGAQVAAAAHELVAADDSGDSVEVTELPDDAAARAAVEAEEADVALLGTDDGWTVVGRTEVDEGLARVLTEAVAAAVLETNAQAAGTTTAELTAGSTVTTELLEGDAEQAEMQRVVGFVFAFLFYMAAIVFGMAIATSVLEEKQNRVVEILATAIPIRQLLYGKVVGNSALALAQVALYAVVGLIGLNLTGTAGEIGWILSASGWFIVFFIVGFTALASVFAVLGSLASRSEDLQSNTGPVLGVIMVAVFAGIFAKGTPLAVASYIPVVSSVAMPVRMLSHDLPVWEPVLSLAITAVAAYLLVRLGERVYQRAVLQGGTALTWRQALRLEA
ncbi:ABC transporter permease [Georgenia sp. EYE_87]|uniref:ABC transporter permease n=1 Tax=Georgenia sp. EYE_87 TaxID=2853448 RepID=UPI00200466FA|nr:ABC transporter permease [Georgenia sp. EYE_87]MCK6211821.1 ABC transporter permease [Georgenia sp. EYE_87]